MVENLAAQTPVLSFDKVKGEFNVSMQDVTLGRPSAPGSSRGRGQARGSAGLKTFKKAVFRVVETNEAQKQDPTIASRHKGYTDIESLEGEYRYKLGIIDFLTAYGASKYLENRFKSARYSVDSSAISATDEATYQARFIDFLNENLIFA
jgi:hypothetical protein